MNLFSFLHTILRTIQSLTSSLRHDELSDHLRRDIGLPERRQNRIRPELVLFV